MYEVGYQHSALHNANVDTNRKESNDVWLAQEESRVRSSHDVWVCVEGQENSEKTEVEACRRVLDMGRYLGANSVPIGDRRKIATQQTKEEHHHGLSELVQRPGQKMPTNTRIEGQCLQGGLST